jgi:hypothetical protein
MTDLSGIDKGEIWDVLWAGEFGAGYILELEGGYRIKVAVSGRNRRAYTVANS